MNIIENIQKLIEESNKKALVIIDYTQINVYEHEVPDWGLTLSKVQGIKNNIIELVNFCRNKNHLIIHIGTTEWVAKKLPDNINKLYSENPEAAFYHKGKDKFIVDIKRGDYKFYKNKYSAFSGTNGKLESLLKSNNINDIIICGVYSTGCVNNTIIEGFAKDFNFTMIKDCTETFDRKDKQDYQKIVFQDWGYMYGKVLTLKEFKNEYK